MEIFTVRDSKEVETLLINAGSSVVEIFKSETNKSLNVESKELKRKRGFRVNLLLSEITLRLVLLVENSG